MDILAQEIRRILRSLPRNPGFSLAVILTLAFGIGSNTAIFSFVNGILLQPLPYHEPERLISIWEDHSLKGSDVPWETGWLTFSEFKKQNQSFESLATWFGWSFILSGDGDAEYVLGSRATSNLFSVLGVEPAQGRSFSDDDQRVAILSHSLWQRRYGGDPDVLGRVLNLDDQNPLSPEETRVAKPYTIIGVMPAEFKIPYNLTVPRSQTEIWIPFIKEEVLPNDITRLLNVVGRLKQGQSFESARSEAEAIAQRLASQYPDSHAEIGTLLIPVNEAILGNTRQILVLLLTATGFLLLIACANVANLILNRSFQRTREMSLCAALGAGRFRLARQVILESLTLALLGGVVGIGLAFLITRLLVGLVPQDTPRLETVGIDGTILLFTLAVSLVTGLIFAIIPAIRVSKPDLREALGEGAKGSLGVVRTRLRGILVVVQVAVTLLLLVGAGLTLRSFLHLIEIDPGFNTKNLLTLRIRLAQSKYPEVEKRTIFLREIKRRIEELPSVESVGLTLRLPLSGPGPSSELRIEGKPMAEGQRPNINTNIGSPGFFEALNLPLLAGRSFEDADDEDRARVSVINQAMAEEIWPGEDPLGRRFGDGSAEDPKWMEVIGVVTNLAPALGSEVVPEFYTNYAQTSWATYSLIVRTSTSDPLDAVAVVREQIAAVDQEVPISNIQTMEAHVDGTLSRPRFILLLLSFFALVALLLAGLGTFAVMAYGVSQRYKEIGIRIAMGANRGDILKKIIGESVRLTAVGILVGAVGAVFLTRLLKDQLFRVSATDPLSFVAGALFLVVVAALAGFFPARRAMRIDPANTLRSE